MKKRATGAKAADARSRLSTARKAVVREVSVLRKRLAIGEALWRYWCTHDITENDDDWAGFTDAVHAHLEGKPVPERFLKK